MTLLVSWIGVDTHGTASAYIAADSRVSWGDISVFDHVILGTLMNLLNNYDLGDVDEFVE